MSLAPIRLYQPDNVVRTAVHSTTYGRALRAVGEDSCSVESELRRPCGFALPGLREEHNRHAQSGEFWPRSALAGERMGVMTTTDTDADVVRIFLCDDHTV